MYLNTNERNKKIRLCLGIMLLLAEVSFAQNLIDVKGRKQGRWVTIDTRLQVKTVSFYKNGLLHGKRVVYDKKGRRLNEAHFRNGQEDGIRINYLLDASRPIDVFFKKHGLMHGTYLGFHKGRKTTSADFENGRLHGEYVLYHKNGRESYLAYFHKGLISHKATSYNKKGKIIEIYHANKEGTVYVLKETYHSRTGKKLSTKNIKQVPYGWLRFGIDVYDPKIQRQIQKLELWQNLEKSRKEYEQNKQLIDKKD